MFCIRSGATFDDVRSPLPGVICASISFGATGLPAVTVTCEKKGCSFERLLPAPISLELLMIAKTVGAIVVGTANAFVPIAMAAAIADLSGIAWAALLPAVVPIAASSTFLGLFIAVSVSVVVEAQTFSDFFRFPMLFLCGLFFPVEQLPAWLRQLSHGLPPTYGADILHVANGTRGGLPLAFDFLMLLAFCVLLSGISVHNVRRQWIA